MNKTPTAMKADVFEDVKTQKAPKRNARITKIAFLFTKKQKSESKIAMSRTAPKEFLFPKKEDNAVELSLLEDSTKLNTFCP